MVEFYRQRISNPTASVADALRAAQIVFLGGEAGSAGAAKAHGVRYAHPFYWSTYIPYARGALNQSPTVQGGLVKRGGRRGGDSRATAQEYHGAKVSMRSSRQACDVSEEMPGRFGFPGRVRDQLARRDEAARQKADRPVTAPQQFEPDRSQRGAHALDKR